MTNFPTAAEFRAWLEAQPPRKVIARDWGKYDCPLALCLTSGGARNVAVMPDEWWCEGVYPAPVPSFAGQFIDRLDDASDLDERGVTARRCLAILRRVAPEAF